MCFGLILTSYFAGLTERQTLAHSFSMQTSAGQTVSVSVEGLSHGRKLAGLLFMGGLGGVGGFGDDGVRVAYSLYMAMQARISSCRNRYCSCKRNQFATYY